jgi:transcriptional regulator with XRE-family HTH domain
LTALSIKSTEVQGTMEIGRTLRELRIAENLSQGDIQRRTGLLRAYTSRVENGRTSPSIATLEKYARALDVPLYTLFCDARRRTEIDLKLQNKKRRWGATKSQSQQYELLVKTAGRMNERQRALFMYLANQLARRGDSVQTEGQFQSRGHRKE